MDWTAITAIIIAIVALYGAALSTFTFLANRKEKKRQVKVELAIGFLAFGPEPSPPMLLISASNPGHRTVTLGVSGILLPNGNKLVLPYPQSNVQFPYDLPEGKSCTVWVEAKSIARELKEQGFSGKVKLVGFYRDSVGATYASKPLRFDVDDWAKGA